MKRILLAYDVHLTTQELHPSYKLFKKFAKDFEPDEIVLGGDFMDCESLSHWSKDKRRKIEGKRWRKELDVANRELDYLQKHSPKITYLAGNHEDWVEQYVDASPEMEDLIEIPIKLNLFDRRIQYLPYNELYQIGELYATHGMYTPKYHANKHLVSLGCNIVYGHTHRPQMDMMNMKMSKPHKAWCLGCLCGHEPDYMKGKPASWMNGFGVLYLNERSGAFNLYPVDIIDNSFMFEGKSWSA